MKKASIILAALGTLAVAMPAMVSPADAYVVRKTVRHGAYGHCRTVRTVKHNRHGRVVVKRHVCH